MIYNEIIFNKKYLPPLKYIVKAFKDSGIKQKDVIRDLNVPQSYASALMNGKKDIGKEVAKKLHDLYGFDEGAMITDKESEVMEVTKEIELLREIIKAKDKLIVSLERENETLREALNRFEGKSKTGTN